MLLLLGTADIKGHGELTLYAGGTVTKLPFKVKHIQYLTSVFFNHQKILVKENAK